MTLLIFVAVFHTPGFVIGFTLFFHLMVRIRALIPHIFGRFFHLNQRDFYKLFFAEPFQVLSDQVLFIRETGYRQPQNKQKVVNKFALFQIRYAK